MIKIAKTDIGRAGLLTGPLRGAALSIALLVALLPWSDARAQSPEPPRQDVHAVGPLWRDADWLYLARSITIPASSGGAAGDTATVSTQIYRRSLSKEFRPFGKPLARRVLTITPVGDQLAVLTEDGNWLLQSEDGAILGMPLSLPEARLIDLASNRDGLYAVAKVRGGVARLAATSTASSTGPATSQTASSAPAAGPASSSRSVSTWPATATATSTMATTTSPATGAAASRPQQNLPDMLAVVMYGGGGWQPVSDIPAQVAGPMDSVSLLNHDGTLFLLVREAPGRVRLWRLDGTKWREVGQARIPEKTRIARLVPGGSKPTVWISPAIEAAAEPDHILVFDAAGLGVTRSIARGPEPDTTNAATGPTTDTATAAPRSPATQPMTGPSDVSASGLVNDMKLAATAGVVPNQRAAAFAFNYFRSITFNGNALSEQAYDAVSFGVVESARSQSFDPPGLPYFDIIRYGLVAAAMAYAIMSSLRRRAELADLEIDPEELPLAPLMPRMMAGLVDGVPLIAGFVVSFIQLPPDADPADITSANLIFTIGFVIYLLTTLLTEVYAGRSFGKMLFGLRVISVDGKPATRSQLATRNILRIIDVLLSFFPLLLIPFSPLRQRAGDAAAATIVVTTHPQPRSEEAPEE